MAEASASGEAIAFGPFRLHPAERRLERDGEPVRLGARALDILLVLVERPGEVVTKRELGARVWVDTLVEEGTLRFQVAALRKALGDGQGGARYVANIAGRGYSLVAPVTRDIAAASLLAPQDPPPVIPAPDLLPSDLLPPVLPPLDFPPPGLPPARLPALVSRMVGREAVVHAVVEKLAKHRFVTIVGPGGMGKTRVAVAAAEASLAGFDDAVHFVDLAPLTAPGLVASAVASSFGLAVASGNPVSSLVNFLKTKRVLIVLDSCEHVIDAVAALAEQIIAAAPRVHLLATSRESLRAEGEHLQRLFPLEVPDAETPLTAVGAVEFPAIRLFVERAAAAAPGFALDDGGAPVVAAICRQLDGLPLAIEFAAARVDFLGLRGVSEGLGDLFGLLTSGRRTALPRQQTLRASLDWSFRLLSPAEQAVLCRLSIFRHGFTLDAAAFVASGAVASGDSLPPQQVREAVATLAAKSMVSAMPGRAAPQHRLLDTTRTYAAERLAAAGGTALAAARHAAWVIEQLRRPERDSAAPAGDGWLVAQHDRVDDARSALEWAFSDHGDRTLAGRLAAATASLLLNMSLLAECFSWAGKALAQLDEAARGSQLDLDLRLARALSAPFVEGGNADTMLTAFGSALELAETLGNRVVQLRVLEGLYLRRLRIADFRGAYDSAAQIEAITTASPDLASGEAAGWMLGVALHFQGRHAEAEAYFTDVLRTAPFLPGINYTDFGGSPRLYSLCFLARTLWLQGRPDSAATTMRNAIDEAEATRSPIFVCTALTWIIQLAFWRGDLDTAEYAIGRLTRLAEEFSLGPPLTASIGLRGELALRRGDSASGIALLRESLAALRPFQYEMLAVAFRCILAEALAASGDAAEALALTEDALLRVERSGEFILLPEALRTKGTLLAATDPAQAEATFRAALDRAQAQGALAWALRAATDIAVLLRAQGRAAEARAVLAPVHGRFREGDDTPDVLAAAALL